MEAADLLVIECPKHGRTGPLATSVRCGKCAEEDRQQLLQLRGNLSLAEEGLANYAQENGRMNAALKLIANDSCDKFTTGPGSCWNHPELTPEAGHTADRWCIPCIALSALVPNQIRALPQSREHGA